MNLKRKDELKSLVDRLKTFPVVAIIGPRQCGKTTLVKQFISTHRAKKIHFFDLENPTDLSKLENPTLSLGELDGIIIIDEIQRKKDLFPVMRYLVDKNPKTKYIILGSASRDLISNSSESLAGRISFLEMSGFSINDVKNENLKKLWIRGGFPRSFLAKGEDASFQWRRDFITTVLERDIPSLGIKIPAQSLRRFWEMLSHYHGQIFNASEIGKSINAADTTVKKYLDVLSGTFLIRQIHPWYYNTKKRLVKSPKIYFRDSGILHWFLSVENYSDLYSHPRFGASWEGFALEMVIKQLGLFENEVFFWSLHSGAELDLFFKRKGKSYGVEVKYSESPKITKSMISAIEELSLEHLWVVYPGKDSYKLDKNISVISIENLKSLTF